MKKMIRSLLYTIFLLFSSVASASWETENEEEALFLRRIADFWQEGEYQIVKVQIEEFLQQFPKSSFAQTLHATLGDLHVREKNFKTALLSYSRLSEPALKDQVFFNRMQCLLELQWFATLADECESTLKEVTLTQEKKEKTTYLLAVALYQQCLNATPDSDELHFLTQRALPYFQTLLQTEYSPEVGPAFAHLHCLQKNYAAASDIYLKLSKDRDNDEELFFQAALLQAKADRIKAVEMFREIEALKQTRVADALYNRIVLMTESGLYEELIQEKEALLEKLPEERRDAARLFFGHSLLKLQRYKEAEEELSLFVETKNDATESLRSGLSDLVEVAYQLEDEALLGKTVERLAERFPNDQQLAKGILAQALFLKNRKRFEDAKQKLQTLLTSPFVPEKERASFEFSHLEFVLQQWDRCRLSCLSFLEQFPQSEYSASVWRFLATSSFHLSSILGLKEQFILDIEGLLQQKKLFSEREVNNWQFYLAKAQYDCKKYSDAEKTIENHLLNDSSSPHFADAHLLLALCHRDGKGNIANFYQLAERALQLGSQLFETEVLQIALFNAALELKDLDRAAEHLYQASLTKTLETSHLLWLADYYYEKVQRQTSEKNLKRAVHALEKFLAASEGYELSEGTLSFEPVLVRLAELYRSLNLEAESQLLLENLKKKQTANPKWKWTQQEQVDFLLAEIYANRGREDEALRLFDAIQERSLSLRNQIAASATLQSARLQLKIWKKARKGAPIKILTQLKNLVLQRTLANEPVHLEAALEYIDLQAFLENDDAEKRLTLSLKTQEDFENGTDLLARDYQQSRSKLPEKDRLYSAYMNLLEAEILLCRSRIAFDALESSEYKHRAQEILAALLEKPVTPFLESRAKKLFPFK